MSNGKDLSISQRFKDVIFKEKRYIQRKDITRDVTKTFTSEKRHRRCIFGDKDIMMEDVCF